MATATTTKPATKKKASAEDRKKADLKKIADATKAMESAVRKLKREHSKLYWYHDEHVHLGYEGSDRFIYFCVPGPEGELSANYCGYRYEINTSDPVAMQREIELVVETFARLEADEAATDRWDNPLTEVFGEMLDHLSEQRLFEQNKKASNGNGNGHAATKLGVLTQKILDGKYPLKTLRDLLVAASPKHHVIYEKTCLIINAEPCDEWYIYIQLQEPGEVEDYWNVFLQVTDAKRLGEKTETYDFKALDPELIPKIVKIFKEVFPKGTI
jgi:hypothetical protein